MDSSTIANDEVTVDMNYNEQINMNVREDIVAGDLNVVSKKKSKFEKNCDYCQKLFKTEAAYDKHVKNQVCRGVDDITLCKLCDITFETHSQYQKHLTSLAHITKIQCTFGMVEKVETSETPMINTADPYLSKEDVDKISKKSLGANFTIKFRDGRNSQVTLVKPRVSNGVSNVNVEKIPQVLLPQQQIQINIPVKIEPSERQLKILTFLEGINSVEKCGEKLVEILKDKLLIEDYKNLQTLIKQSENMSAEMISAYINAIDKFTMAMVKLKNKGQVLFRDKDIATIVMYLTS